MPPKGKKGKDAKAKPAPPVKGAKEPPPKPKKIPPPPACFTPEDLAKFKEVFKAHDEDNVDKVPIEDIPLMLRKLGFNPKTAEVNQLYVTFLEDDLVDTVELHEWYQMIEAKMIMGDDFELAVTKAFAALGHDDEEVGLTEWELLRTELEQWGEPLQEIEFIDWIRLAVKDKTLNVEEGTFNYPKFIENMNNKDHRYIKEPINFFKLDQKTLAEMAMKKAAEEKAEEERKEAEKKAREEARRLKMIADGLLPPD
ncbi:calmodulin-like [Plodia interpunctella]|uniref:calmodulin-like n=1 Tax=Plodia interpunctella TaxID=58824 RepID=UPI0023682B67|nr:calmodulin-like [Plodia interpunctella]